MKKSLLSMCVVAFFAMGFAASGDSEEVRYDNAGRKYYKKIPKCTNCGKENPHLAYWEDDKGNKIFEVDDSNWIRGKYYCSDCLHDDNVRF